MQTSHLIAVISKEEDNIVEDSSTLREISPHERMRPSDIKSEFLTEMSKYNLSVSFAVS